MKKAAAVKVLQIRLEEYKFKRLEEEAKKSGVSMSEYAREIIFGDEEPFDARELNKKYQETIEGECLKYLKNSIETMSLAEFISLKAFLKRRKKEMKGDEFMQLPFNLEE